MRQTKARDAEFLVDARELLGLRRGLRGGHGADSVGEVVVGLEEVRTRGVRIVSREADEGTSSVY
jgi:hypothetical protein